MRKIAAALVMTLVAGPALIARPAVAQEDHVQRYREATPDKTPGQRESDAAAARAYQRSLNAVPDKKPVDPWGIARDDEAKKPAAPAKPAMKSTKAKTGTTASGTTN
jgi:hypothetical protein